MAGFATRGARRRAKPHLSPPLATKHPKIIIFCSQVLAAQQNLGPLHRATTCNYSKPPMFKKSRRRSKRRERDSSLRSTGSNNSSSVGTLRGILKIPAAVARGDHASLGGSSVGSKSTITTTRDPVNGSRTVDFKSITVREYERTLGDNPSCSSGAPIS